MSDKELIQKFYYGSYKINSKGFLSCVLYNERKNAEEQECDFYIENEYADLTDEQFDSFWAHVQLDHPVTYVNILETCRSKIPHIPKTNKFDKLYDSIAISFGNVNKLTSLLMIDDLKPGEFMEQFKLELSSLEKKVSEIIKPMIDSNTAPTTWSNL